MINKATLLGRITQDLELRATKDGKPVLKMTIATNDRYVTKEGEVKESAEFHDCVVWGKQAEIIKQYCYKGGRIYVEGKMTKNEYTNKEGVKYVGKTIQVQSFEFIDTVKKDSQSSNSNFTTEESVEDLPF